MRFLVIVVAALVAVSTANPTGKSFGVYTGPRLAVAAPSIDSYESIQLPAVNIAAAPSQKSYTAAAVHRVAVAPAPAPAPAPVVVQRPQHKSYTAVNVPAPTVRISAPAPTFTYTAPAPTVRVSAPTHKSYSVNVPVSVALPPQTVYAVPAPVRVTAPAHKSYSIGVQAPTVRRTYTTNLVPSAAVASPYTKSQTSYSTRPVPVSAGTTYYGTNIVAPQRISYIQATPDVVTSTRYHVQDQFGQYNYGYATSDGQAKTEIRGIDGTVAGRYSYIDPNGKHVIMSYVADEDGFRVAGNNLPQAPELPDELAREYDLAHSRLAAAKAKAALSGSDDGDDHHDDHDDDDHGIVAVVVPAPAPAPAPAPEPVQYVHVHPVNVGAQIGQYVHVHRPDDGHHDTDGGGDDGDDDHHDDGQYVHRTNDEGYDTGKYVHQEPDADDHDAEDDNDDERGQYKVDDHDDDGDGKDDRGQYKHDDGGDEAEEDDGDDDGEDQKQTTYYVGTVPGAVQQSVQTVSAPAAQYQTTSNVYSASLPVVQQLLPATSGLTVPARAPLPTVSQIYSVVGAGGGVTTTGGAKSIGSGHIVPTSNVGLSVAQPQQQLHSFQTVAVPQQPHVKSGYSYTG